VKDESVIVKRSEPNTLQRELARSQQVGPHPDADLLTAFAENALPEREQKQLIAHLAVCADCREILSVAASAAPVPVRDDLAHVPPRSIHPQLRKWLRWAATAAGVVVVSAAVLLHQRKQESKPNSENNASVAATAPAQAPEQPDKQLRTAIAQAPKPVHNRPAPGPTPKAVEPASQTSDAVITSEIRKHSEMLETNQQTATPVTAAIAGATPAAQGAPPSISPAASVSHAPAFAMSKAIGLPDARTANAVGPHWRINSGGQVERSIGDSAWQPVLLNEKSKMRVVAVFSNDVWVGGEDLRLYHSSDNGTTWSLISLPGKTGGEQAIAHIVFQSPQAGTVEAGDGTSWTTIDGGKTWK
jgi:hypothetical protein